MTVTKTKINIIYLSHTNTPRLCWSMTGGEVWRGVARVNWDVQDYGYRIVMKIEEELSKM